MILKKSLASVVQRLIKTREENSRLRGRILDLEDRIRELEERLHERDLNIVELAEDRNEWIVAGAAKFRRAAEAERKLADRDAAWEEAIQLNYDQTFGLNVDGFIIVVRRWIENKEGKM